MTKKEEILPFAQDSTYGDLPHQHDGIREKPPFSNGNFL